MWQKKSRRFGRSKKEPPRAPITDPEELREHHAAKRIQGNFRATPKATARREEREQNAAADAIQKQFRQRPVQVQKREERQQNTAATAIQSKYRGKISRKVHPAPMEADIENAAWEGLAPAARPPSAPKVPGAGAKYQL